MTAAEQTSGVITTLDELLHLRFLARRVTLFSRRRVHSHQLGPRLSHFRGRGMEFEEVRPYQPGDDIRLINWQMTARMGRPFTKVYQEERELPVHLLVDQSSSMYFGTRVAFKSVIAARIAALLGWSALQHGDQVGGIVFNDYQYETIQPKRQRKTFLKLLSTISHYSQQQAQQQQAAQQNNLFSGIQRLSQQKTHGTLIILISDFINCHDETLQHISQLASKNRIMMYFVYDYLEYHVPDPNIYYISNGTEQATVNTQDQTQANLYKACFQQRFDRIKKHCKKYNIGFTAVSSEDNLVQKLSRGGSDHG
ncbi:MAG: DUF58 domain-containing protein [Pseudomonadota bacterium]